MMSYVDSNKNMHANQTDYHVALDTRHMNGIHGFTNLTLHDVVHALKGTIRVTGTNHSGLARVAFILRPKPSTLL